MTMGAYSWKTGEAGGWRIGLGPSNFLIAEGSGFSRSIGRELFVMLQSGAFPDGKHGEDFMKRDSVINAQA